MDERVRDAAPDGLPCDVDDKRESRDFDENCHENPPPQNGEDDRVAELVEYDHPSNTHLAPDSRVEFAEQRIVELYKAANDQEEAKIASVEREQAQSPLKFRRHYHFFYVIHYLGLTAFCSPIGG